MLTVVVALAIPNLNTLNYDAISDMLLVVDYPALHALYNLLALELVPEVLSEYSLTMAYSIYVEVES